MLTRKQREELGNITCRADFDRWLERTNRVYIVAATDDTGTKKRSSMFWLQRQIKEVK